jgi:zinc protease
MAKLRSFVAAVSTAACVGFCCSIAHAGAVDGGNATETTLTNGLRLVIVPMKQTPLTAVGVVYRVGSADAPSSDPGVNAAVANMLSTHVAGLSRAQLSELSAALGGRSSEAWDYRTTVFYNEVAASDVSAALRVEADRMRGFGASNDDWDVERSVFAQGAAMNEGNFNVLWHARMLHALQPKSPIAHDQYSAASSIVGDSFSVAERFREMWYTPSNAVLFITGNVDPHAILADVQTDFGSLPRRDTPKQTGDGLKRPKASMTLFNRNLISRPAYACLDEPGSSSRDFASAQVLNDIVQSKSSALSALVDSGKALHVSFTEVFTDPQVSVMCAQADVALLQDNQTLAVALRDALARYAKLGVSAEDVSSAITTERLQHAIEQADARSNMLDWATFVCELGYSSPTVYYDAVERVKPSDVDRVARAYFASGSIALGRVLPAPPAPRAASVNPPSASTAVGLEALPQWASAVSRDVDASLASVPVPSDTTLSNGVRVITVNRPESGIIQLFGRVKVSPHMATPDGKDGVDLVLARLFANGPADMTHRGFARLVDALGGQESAGADFSLSVLPSDFDRGLALLSDAELHPSFETATFARAKRDALNDSGDQSISVGRFVERALDGSLLPPDDPAARVATPLTVSGLNADDVRSYFAAAYRPERTTVVVVGDVTPATAVAAVEKAFGSWSDPPTAAAPDALPPLPQNQPARVVLPNPALGIRYVMLGETLDVAPASDDYDAFALGMDVLGGDPWSSRLVTDILDRSGLAVAVIQKLDVQPTRSTVTITYVCAPVNAVRVRNIIAGDIRALQTVPLKQDELDRARSLLVRQLLLQMGSPSDLAQQYLGFAAFDLPLDSPARRAAGYMMLTANDVMHALAAKLRGDGFVDVEFGTQ